MSLVGAGDRSIVIAELYYLNEKKGRPLDFRTKYAPLAQSKQFVLLPFYPSHTLDFDACSAVTEMHNRMIAADARRTNATLLTRDAQMTSSGVVATVVAFESFGLPHVHPILTKPETNVSSSLS